MALAHSCRRPGFSSVAPPSLTTYLICDPSNSQQACRFVEAGHHVKVLGGLTGSALEQVVEAGDDHASPAIVCQMKTDVTVVGVDRILNLRQLAGGEDAHQRAAGKEAAIESLDVVGLLFSFEPHVNGGEDAARDGQQVWSEDNLLVVEVELLQQLSGVAMREKPVSGEIVRGVHEVRFRGRRFARAGD